MCCEGSLVTVCGLMTFTSPRSMEIEVIVEYESLFDINTQSLSEASTNTTSSSSSSNVGRRQKAVDAFFTFVAIDANGKATPVPSLMVNIMTWHNGPANDCCLSASLLLVVYLMLLLQPFYGPGTLSGTTFSTISLQVFFGLPLGLAPSTLYSIHFFTQSLSSFCNTCPYHHNLFRCSTEIMSSNPSLSLNSLLGILSCSFTPHIHLTILISAC